MESLPRPEELASPRNVQNPVSRRPLAPCHCSVPRPLPRGRPSSLQAQKITFLLAPVLHSAWPWHTSIFKLEILSYNNDNLTSPYNIEGEKIKYPLLRTKAYKKKRKREINLRFIMRLNMRSCLKKIKEKGGAKEGFISQN